jgi:hypothetical protein
VLFVGLSHTLYRAKVIADGRCSVASVLAALEIVGNQHNDRKSIQVIDKHRRELGQSMISVWSEEAWIRIVPNELRGASTKWEGDNMVRRSFDVYHELLTQRSPATWLDNCVFYLANVHYDVGIFVLYFTTANTGSQVRCRRIGAENSRHIVIYQTSTHYECVQYNGLRIFPSTHELIVRMISLSTSHPPQAAVEDDHELWAIREAQPAASMQPATTQPAPPSSESEQPMHAPETLSIPKTLTSPIEIDTAPPQTPIKLRGITQRSTSAKTRRTLSFATPHDPTASPNALLAEAPATNTICTAPPLVVQVADHGPLYEHVSFRNQPHWRAANEPLWNAYRVASEKREYSRLVPIILDILQLPARMLAKLSRAGKRARRRTRHAVRQRCLTEGEKLRARYNCPDPDLRLEQEVQLSTETMANTRGEAEPQRQRPRRAASVAAAKAIATATTTEDEDEDDNGTSEGITPRPRRKDEREAGEDDGDNDPFHAYRRRTGQHPSGPDAKAAKRAQYLIEHNLTRKAAQVLHSTAAMVDLRSEAAQQDMLRLHPLPPSTSSIPAMPPSAPPTVLEDDEHLQRLIRRSDNGTAAGPSGWCGNMLSSLAQSDICRLGILALLRDIINGDLPDEAREVLLASRLIALSKPNGSCRPIAVGEQLYRLAAIVAINRVSETAATLLAPHQYGVGVPAGAERILHSLQHKLTDRSERLALLQLDISNAFNTCDRARLLRELYALPALQPIFRIVNCAYSQPSTLLLQGCDGQAIMSSQGVKQGDPLSALLFCVYMRDVLQKVHAKTQVTVYGFFDDINVVGKPRQVMDALNELQTLLPSVSLQLNTSKSHFAYFHDELTPLPEQVRTSLANNNIHCHHDWISVVGAVVGRDDDAIRCGISQMLLDNGGHQAFFDRIQLQELSLNSVMLLLRQCMVPSMNYLLRCTAPTCIEEQAIRFDRRMMDAAMDKLGIADHERGNETTTLLQSKLKHGGWGLAPATSTSPAAFLGSLAACCDEDAFKPYQSESQPLPPTSQLHGWIDDSMRRMQQAAPSTACDELLPATADVFFTHFSRTNPSAAVSLQTALHAKATQHKYTAAVEQLKRQSREGDKRPFAHHKTITAPGAWTWKMTLPIEPRMRLTDTEYAVAARLNLDLPPFLDMSVLPDTCPLCVHNRTKEPISLKDDPWHFLSCSALAKGEASARHNEVAEALRHAALLVGAQTKMEVKGLARDSNIRPDLQLFFPGRMLLTDVVISHPLTEDRILHHRSSAAVLQSVKRTKYSNVASRLGAELMPFSLETLGGMADEAMKFVQAIGEAGEETMGTWSKTEIMRYTLAITAAAVQRGNARIMLAGRMQALKVVEMKKGERENGGRQRGE